MDLVVKGRGIRVGEQFRRATEQKLKKLARLEPRAVRVEIEVMSERNRLDGVKRVEAVLATPRRVFRATASAPESEIALDQVLARLERQVKDYHERRRIRQSHQADRIQSGRTGTEEAGASD